jgi:hypothetical protein
MDPVQRIRREKEAQKEMAARQGAKITIADAIDRWLKSEKDILIEKWQKSLKRAAPHDSP